MGGEGRGRRGERMKRGRERGRESKSEQDKGTAGERDVTQEIQASQENPPSLFSSLTNWEICESSNIPAAQAMMVCTNVSFLSTAATTLSRWAGYWGIISRCVEGRE